MNLGRKTSEKLLKNKSQEPKRSLNFPPQEAKKPQRFNNPFFDFVIKKTFNKLKRRGNLKSIKYI